MRHDAGVHQRGGGIAIFVTEIGADQLALYLADLGALQVQCLANRIVAGQEDRAGLPVARFEIAEHELQLDLGGLVVQRQHGIGDATDAAGHTRHRRCLDRNMKRPNHDTCRIGLQAQRTMDNIEQVRAPGSGFGILRVPQRQRAVSRLS